MEIGTVSTVSMVGMVVSMIVAVLLPIVLCVVVMKKTKAKLVSLVWGCGVFFVFALVLEQILHTVVLTVTGTKLTGNIWLYALYGATAAAVFEETGRFIAMKFGMKKYLSKENALMYGVGHGGIEAILLVGVAQVSNIITSFMINENQLDIILGALDETQKAATVESLSALWTTPGYMFFLGGVERVFAIMLQISFSVFMYVGVKQAKKSFVAVAFALHFLVDFIMVVLADKIPTLAVEGAIGVMAVAVGVVALKLYKKAE